MKTLTGSGVLPATRPADYPLGSLESRAAARALSEEKAEGTFVFTDGIVEDLVAGKPVPAPPFRVTDWDFKRVSTGNLRKLLRWQMDLDKPKDK